MSRALVFGFFLGVVAAVAQGCIIRQNPGCSASTCDGCCDASGQCQGGGVNSACGSGGQACSVCPVNFACSLGACQSTGTGGGAGGGVGGGVGGGGGTTAQRGNVTFLWTFGGRPCSQVPAVATVAIDIPGQTLANAGVYGCTTSGSDGIVLLDFAPGVYAFTIRGRSTSSTALYQATGNFTVNGNVTVTVDLAAASGAPGNALLTWTFPANGSFPAPNCSQAGVTNVDIRVDNGTPQRFACTAGFGTTGVQLTNLAAGSHSIDLAAADANDFFYYRKISTLTIVAGSTVSSAYAFDWGVGSLPMKWSFTNGSVAQTCAQAGVAQVNIVLEDAATGTRPYGTAGQDVPCASAGVQGTMFPYLYPAGYKVFLQALGTGATLYRSNFTSPPVLTVTAGQFPQVDASTTVIVMQP